MSALIRAFVIVLVASVPAFADPMRVLLADADPELHRAIKATLAPWRLEVVVDAEPPTDTTHAQMRGDAKTARFVVWRENGELVVFDRERGAAEHREAPAGPLDPASAAAAALTVKTLMRLPPPEVATTATDPPETISTSVPVTETGPELRMQAGLATRMTRSGGTTFGARASLAAFVRPSSLGLRFGVLGEIGSSNEIKIKTAGFKGAWSDWSVVALASWAFAVTPKWEIEPYVGAGAQRSKLDGEEGMMDRHERETLPTLRGGAFVRVRTGWFSFGGVVGFDATPGTPTYTRATMGMGGSELFEVPPFALSLGLIAAADL